MLQTCLTPSHRGLAACTPSLANLCRAVLGRELRQPHAPHYCGDDAAAAMGVARYLVDGGPMCIAPPTVQVLHGVLWRWAMHVLQLQKCNILL